MYGIYDNGKVIAQFAAPMTVRSNQPVFVSDTLSLKRFISRRSAQRWEIEAGLEPLTSSAGDLFVNLVTKGYSETVTVIMPQNYGIVQKRTLSSTPVTATGSAGATSVTVAANTGFMPKGTFVKFSSHSKIYMTTSDRTTNGAVSIYPALSASVSGTMFCGDDVQLSCLYDTDVVSGMVYSDGIQMDVGTVRLVEKL
jgi:hypothetical protein